jgi:hypothetical protein
MDGMPGWLVGDGHPNLSLTRFSHVKTFNGVFQIKPVLRWPVLERLDVRIPG